MRIAHINVRSMSFDKQEEIKYTLKEMSINICCLTETHGNMNGEWGKYEVHSARKESEGKAGGGHLGQREIRCDRNKGIQ